MSNTKPLEITVIQLNNKPKKNKKIAVALKNPTNQQTITIPARYATIRSSQDTTGYEFDTNLTLETNYPCETNIAFTEITRFTKKLKAFTYTTTTKLEKIGPHTYRINL